MVQHLADQHMLDSTLIIVTAKHGQSPIDTSRYKANGKPNDPASILSAFLAPSEKSPIGPTEDDVALLWLNNPADTAAAVAALQLASPVGANKAGIGEIFSGPSMGLFFNVGDSRTPDILVTPNIGVTYSNSVAKEAEHGGFAKDDVNVIMLLSNPSFSAKTVTSPVETAQVAPTILKALGLDPNSLESVQLEHTQLLPEAPLSGD
jgi:arylsulfatase A-like enzyme